MNRQALSPCADVAVTQEILADLQTRLGPQKYNAWFRHGATVSVDDSHAQVSVPNPFVADWIEKHYACHVAEAVEACTGRRLPVVVTIDPELSGQLRKKQLDDQADIVTKTRSGKDKAPYVAPASTVRHRLVDFVVGTSNRLAYSAAQAVVRNAAPFNPLFIHGQCGVGKTHLLQGICNAASGARRGGRAIAWRYVTGEQFTNEFVHALRRRKFAEFRARYRGLDLLAIDDVHFLGAKNAIQEEFLHTFNAIESAGKQIVLASDAHPRKVRELNAQLASRFVAGMVVSIDPPDKATRLEILRRKSAAMDLAVAPEVMEYVARHVRSSARELEGTLFKLAALSSLESAPATMEMARAALADHLSKTDSVLTLGEIETIVSAFFGVTPADMHSSRKTRIVSVARQVTMFLTRRYTSMSYPEIGRAMGKNHSSVVLAVKRMEGLLADEADLKWTGVMGRKAMPAKDVVAQLSSELS